MPESLTAPPSNKTRISLVSESESAPTDPKAAAWTEETKRHRESGTISLRNSILLLSFFSVVSVALVSVIPSYTFGFSSVDNISDQLQEQTIGRIQREVQAALDLPHEALRVFELTRFKWSMSTNSLPCDNFAARYSNFGIVDNTTRLSQAYVGYQDGGIISMVKDTGKISIGCGSKQTNYVLQRSPPADWNYVSLPFANFTIVRNVTGYNSTLRAWYKEAVRVNGTTWGPVYSSFTLSGATLAITAVRPIYDDIIPGKIIAVGGVEINLNLVKSILEDIYISKNGRVYMVQKDGKLIANTLGAPIADASGMIRYDKAANDLIVKSGNKLKKDASGNIIPISDIRSFSIMKGDTEYLTFASTLIDPRGGIEWTIVVLIPRSDIFSSIDRMIMISSVLTAVLFVVTLAITLVVSTYITSPLNVVADAMYNISRLEFEKRTSHDSESHLKEIRIIQSSFQVMDTALQSFGKFVPMAVVKKIVADADNQDIEGFTSLSETLSAESLVEILSEYLHEVSSLVMNTGGTVADFIGDAIVALWNAPTNVTDHAMCGCVCAIRYMRIMDQLNSKWLSKKLISKPLKVRVGVHTGPVLSGNIGSTNRMKYDAIGDSMNLASRLESLNKRYGSSVIISDETKAAVVPRMVARPFEFVVVKGKTTRTLVYELLADCQEDNEAHLKSAMAKLEASRAFEHFTQMTPFQRTSAVSNLQIYCQANPEDKVMSRLMEIVSTEAYEGVTVLDDK
eukprot:TRINITY_DN441_c0_g1_i4.p1 TRINITY_DN441_c0_g1~~TRINITY_DN441_c0_g1_i4.p1  ORF type:complete len:739 (-),score=146.93 TRINITY_DN441_c0_g1_i4:307-2523(-)